MCNQENRSENGCGMSIPPKRRVQSAQRSWSILSLPVITGPSAGLATTVTATRQYQQVSAVSQMVSLGGTAPFPPNTPPIQKEES